MNQAAKEVFAPWLDATAKPYVSIQHVTKKFGDFTALTDLSLDIYQREFFSLLGPSGCGKTTLLRMLAGFERPTEGRILLDGEDVAQVPPYDRPVNMMFQSYALFPHMSVEANIAFGLKQEGCPKAEIKQRVEEVMELVQITPYARRRPAQLSGGQRQRVALARSLVKRPKLLLLDEPLGALDKNLRERTQFELMDIQEKLGLTFIIVTHDQSEAMTMSSRIAVMDHGQIEQVGTPAQLYEQPGSRYVASFLGDVNLLDARISHQQDAQLELDCKDTGNRLYAETEQRLPTGTPVALAIRPEKIDLHTEAPSQARNCVSGIVWDIGYLGNLSVYHVKLDNGKIITTSQANRFRQLDMNIRWNDRVYLSWQPEAAVVLAN
ncbi:ABC transporter ATP-binding protein [Balneatrix alpica]|uniref:Spermidine/putrescine import ATP-binding protein PotA n=1 Tax=Balneatrix alpica TaxID=75684 RepID=A0ABV5ZF52_9GAMM|nr:ABC transporter ATP-binding protein [Balneatrix alpica]